MTILRSMLTLAAFNVDSTTLVKAVFFLMAVGGSSFLYLTRDKH